MSKSISSSSSERIPPYVAVYNSLYSDLASGVYALGQRLPGELELAEQYGVGRHTLRQALVILAEDGLIVKRHGSGNYVSERLPQQRENGKRIQSPIITFARREIDNIHIEHNYGPPTQVAQRRLNISASEIVLAANSLYRCEKDIVAHSFVQIPVSFIQAQKIDLHSDEAIYDLINTVIYEKAARTELFFRVIATEGEVLEMMQIPRGTTLVYIEQLLFDADNTAIARNKLYMQPHEFDIQYSFSIL